VRLLRGERARMRVVHEDPVALARRLASEAAAFLHVVDIDAAFGDGDNLPAVGAILAAAPCPVQVGGGVRAAERFRRLRELGAARVVVGTAAVSRPELLRCWLADDPEAVVVAADARGGRVLVKGWTEEAGEGVRPFAAAMRRVGVRRLLVTGVERDGTGAGPDTGVLEEALAGFGPGVIASGGIGRPEHLEALRPLVQRGLAGVVVGSLLVEGRATVGDLEAVVEEW
jgi:phosphoribosylformimino-5-aminoimidazole carboxamide ribotide isomerase